MNRETKQKKGIAFETYVYNKLKDEWGLTLQHCTTKQEQYTKGENYQGWEIKNDQTFNKTNNLYISVERRYTNKIYASGLYKCKLIAGFTTEKGGKEYGFLLNKENADRICVGKFVNQYNLL
mgnify:CR=1 FL=1